MNSKTLVCLAVIASLGAGSVSFAQPRDRDDRGPRAEQHEHQRAQREHQRAQRERQREHREDRDRRHEERDWEREHAQPGPFYYGARGPEWRRGHRVPPEYRHRQYVVENWRGHHLPPPPRGYQWIEVGGDYVLIAIATGIIAQLILNNR